MTFSHAIWLAVGGGLGTLSRVLVIMLAVRLCGRDFPWGTFVVNLFGSFLFGLIVAFGRGRMSLPAGLETILLIGFLGGFTTQFPSFAFQSYELFQEGEAEPCWSLHGRNNSLWFGSGLGRCFCRPIPCRIKCIFETEAIIISVSR